MKHIGEKYLYPYFDNLNPFVNIVPVIARNFIFFSSTWCLLHFNKLTSSCFPFYLKMIHVYHIKHIVKTFEIMGFPDFKGKKCIFREICKYCSRYQDIEYIQNNETMCFVRKLIWIFLLPVFVKNRQLRVYAFRT